MSNTYEFEGVKPVIDASAFVHPAAVVVGNVQIGKDVYVGPGATIRGDWGEIIIEDGCNVQESCTIHMFPGVTVRLEAAAHIGHGAIVHGACIGANALVGMNAVVMDNARVGAGAIVGALALVPSEMVVPERKLVVGNPARIVRDVSDDMLAWKSDGTALYQSLPESLRRTLKPCTPLRRRPKRRASQAARYKTWRETLAATRGVETGRRKRQTAKDES
ncbi:MAG: transferase hexapeptide repeat family protein [Proteobacteria bacterium]|nr:transferase hexapeptide repeat family protein [Pseudomonadota bacterium]